jgi:hypothetical protein
MTLPKPTGSVAFRRYVALLDALLLERALHGALPDDVEERFVVAMNDCRQSMTSDEESRIAEIVAQRRNVEAETNLGLVDTDPAKDGIPFKKVG